MVSSLLGRLISHLVGRLTGCQISPHVGSAHIMACFVWQVNDFKYPKYLMQMGFDLKPRDSQVTLSDTGALMIGVCVAELTESRYLQPGWDV